jgi:hypothetical protein
MLYGEKRKHQEFIVKYCINYPSGKKYFLEISCYAYSEIGASDTLKWLRKGRNITIISIIPTGKFVGDPVYPSNHVVGER